MSGSMRTPPTSALPFAYTAVMSMDDCIKCLQKLTSTHRPSDIAFFRVDDDIQRFYIRSRAFRSRLIEAQGMLQRDGAQQTKISGQVYGDSLAMPLIGAFVVGALLLLILAFSLWMLLIVAAALILLALYWHNFMMQVAADKTALVRQIVLALKSSAETDKSA